MLLNFLSPPTNVAYFFPPLKKKILKKGKEDGIAPSHIGIFGRDMEIKAHNTVYKYCKMPVLWLGNRQQTHSREKAM